MKRIDRYVIGLFLRASVVCFLSMTGMFLVIDLFANLDEFLGHIQRQGMPVLAEYYLPRVLMFFDRISPLLALLGVLFAITWMQRHRETMALLSLGIPQRRLVWPLLGSALAVALLAVANRELGLPRFRDALTRNAQSWSPEQPRPVVPTFDHQTRILLAGKHVVVAARTIVEPSFQLPGTFPELGEVVTARIARYEPADNRHPAGYRLVDVRRPREFASIGKLAAGKQLVWIGPRAAPWLGPHELFLATDVPLEELAYGRRYRTYLSSWELLQGLHNASLDFGAEARVALHGRLIQPMLDVALILLGLPLVTRRHDGNLFLAAGLGILLVIGFLGVVLLCRMLGSCGLLGPPALAAWLPLFVFGPPAYAALRRGWDHPG